MPFTPVLFEMDGFFLPDTSPYPTIHASGDLVCLVRYHMAGSQQFFAFGLMGMNGYE